MADKKISQLTAKGSAIASTDLIEISESNGAGGYVTKSVTGANILNSKQDTLISGTNINSINNNSILGFGNIDLQETLVSGTNITTINSASILNSGNVNLQTPLVSGTSIKTINSATILGSGNIAVQDTLVSGTNIKTINSATILSSGNLSLQDTLVSGTNIKSINTNTLVGSGDLSLPIGVHILTKPVSGRTYSVRTNGTAIGSNTSTLANTIALYPFIPANSLTISKIELLVASGLALSNIKILVYSDLNGVPNTKLIESASLDCSAGGVKTHNVSFTFNAGTVYWLGTFANLGVTVQIFSDSQMTPISTGHATVPFTASYYSVTAAATFPTAPTTLGTVTLSQSITTLCVLNLTAA